VDRFALIYCVRCNRTGGAIPDRNRMLQIPKGAGNLPQIGGSSPCKGKYYSSVIKFRVQFRPQNAQHKIPRKNRNRNLVIRPPEPELMQKDHLAQISLPSNLQHAEIRSGRQKTTMAVTTVPAELLLSGGETGEFSPVHQPALKIVNF